jgi:hypothetical protein
MSAARARCGGAALVELAVAVPFLLLLACAMADIGRALQADLALVNISREGANLAARGAQLNGASSQRMMNALAATTPPLQMGSRGMIYISKILGHLQGGAVRNVIVEQYRWEGNPGYAPASAVWQCGAWSANQCSAIPANPNAAASVAVMAGRLADGEVIYAVEAYYRYEPLFVTLDLGAGALDAPGPTLYALTIL